MRCIRLVCCAVAGSGRKSTVAIPYLIGSTTGDATLVASGATIPVVQFALGGITLGPTLSIKEIVAFSRELFEHSTAADTFQTLLLEKFARTYDAVVFSNAAASATRPGRGGLITRTPCGYASWNGPPR